MRLPYNLKRKNAIFSLELIVQSKDNWKQIFDYSSDHSLLYTLNIIGLLNKKERSQWNEKFIKLGGFEHLLECFVKLNLKKIENSLSLKCLDSLV